MTTKRNEGLIHFAAVIVVAGLIAVTVIALTDSRKGRTLFSASLEDRVSRHYILKTASNPQAADDARVVPGRGGYENGAVNIVTAVVTDYRILDTLGEIVVLFAAAGGVALLMRERKRNIDTEASDIVKTGIPIIMVFASVVGLYIISHGHLSPGGGFPGGAVIASAFIIQFLAFRKKTPKILFKILESFAGLSLLALGLLGLFLEGSFFANFLPTGVLGATISAGLIMVIYGLIGLKVSAELSAISGDFIGE